MPQATAMPCQLASMRLALDGHKQGYIYIGLLRDRGPGCLCRSLNRPASQSRLMVHMQRIAAVSDDIILAW